MKTRSRSSKISFLDRRLLGYFLAIISALSAVATLALIFVDVPKENKTVASIIFLLLMLGLYVAIFIWANRLKEISIYVEGSQVTIKEGDIFEQSDFKAIAFNEFFDTQVDDSIVAKASLNGMFIERFFGADVQSLDSHIESYNFDSTDLLEVDAQRSQGKKQRYRVGAICVYNDFLITAFAKFDENNKAVITMPEYLEFLIGFWDRVNNIYAQKSVSVPVFGSGITRIKGHKNISDEDLLKIMLWTFRISEMRFKYPAKLTIVIHQDKIDQINLFELKTASSGV